jgi:Host cell surface-exposed lipoprotein
MTTNDAEPEGSRRRFGRWDDQIRFCLRERSDHGREVLGRPHPKGENSHSGANWMKQAVRAAKEYLRSQAFSRRGLVEQLEYDGFTPSQALHGARTAGL